MPQRTAAVRVHYHSCEHKVAFVCDDLSWPDEECDCCVVACSEKVAQSLAWLLTDAEKNERRWRRAEHIVVKRYMEAENDMPESYWDDVKLQMVCKMDQ